MKLFQALKRKNELVGEISELSNLVQDSNSTIEGNKFDYNINELLNKLRDKKEDLVNLKESIQKANGPILNYIYKISELKDTISTLKGMSTQCGQISSEWHSDQHSKPVIYKTQINLVKRNEMILVLRDTIKEYQESIDMFNHKIDIDIEVE